MRVCTCTCTCTCVNRQYEEKQLKGQQERDRKRLEFNNQVSRLQNQLAYEEQRDTSGESLLRNVALCSTPVDVTRCCCCCCCCCCGSVNMKKLMLSVRDDESSISSLQEDERNKLSVSSTLCMLHSVHTAL